MICNIILVEKDRINDYKRIKELLSFFITCYDFWVAPIDIIIFSINYLNDTARIYYIFFMNCMSNIR